MREMFVATLIALSALLLFPPLVSAQKQTRTIYLNVTDQTGSAVPNLAAADFAVLVGGVTQTVTRATLGAPMRIVLFVDASGAVSPMLTEFRAGLNAFLDALPPESEVALITTAGQIGVRQAPTTDRARLKAAANGFTSLGGGNAFLDALLETDKRFLKNAPDRWPVLVILTTDAGEMRGAPNVQAFNAFTQDFIGRGGNAHALVIKGSNSGLITDLALNLANNTGGVYEGMAASTAVVDKMKALGARLATDQQKMANRYVIEFVGDAKGALPIEVRLPSHAGLRVQVSGRRPF